MSLSHAARPVPPPRVSRILVVLPAYNEEANIGNLLRRIFESLTDEHLGFSIIVVNDGSSDRTQQILEEYGREFPLTVHRHESNQGLGATMRDGLRQAAEVASEPEETEPGDDGAVAGPGAGAVSLIPAVAVSVTAIPPFHSCA